MPATLILTTPDPGLEAAWKHQLRPREPVSFARNTDLQRELLRPGARVWVTDINDPRTRFAAGTGTLVILVGQPHSQPFEHARQNRTARLFLSYEESRTRLAESVGLLEEIADKSAQLQTTIERTRQSAPPFPRESMSAPASGGEPIESWDFLESALSHLGDRTRLLEREMAQGRLRAEFTYAFGRILSEWTGHRAGPPAEPCRASSTMRPPSMPMSRGWTAVGVTTAAPTIRVSITSLSSPLGLRFRIDKVPRGRR